MKTRLLKLALSAVVAALPIGAWAEGTGYDEVFMVDYAKIATEKWNVVSSTGSQQISRNTSIDKRIDNEKVYPFQVIKSESTILDYNEVYVASGNYYLSLISVDLIGLRCTNSNATRIGIFDLQKDNIVEIATNGGNASKETPTESVPTTPYNLSAFAKQDGTYGHTYVHTASRTARYYVYKATVSADGAVSFMVSNNCYIAYIKVLRPYTAYTLTTTASPAAGGSISGNDDGTYKANTTVNLTATPNAGYDFANWTINGTEVGTETTYSVTMDADKEVVANFAAQSRGVSTTTIWTFNSMSDVINTNQYLADDDSNNNLYANCKSGSNSTERTFTPTALGSNQTLVFADGYTITVSKVLAVNGDIRNPNNMPEGSTATSLTGDYGQGFLAFDASVAGTLYVYMKGATAAKKNLRIYHSQNVSNSKISAAVSNVPSSDSTDLLEVSYTSSAAGTFFFGLTGGGGGRIYAARFVPTSEKKDEWVYIGSTGYATWGNNSGKDIESLPEGLTAYAATANSDMHSVNLTTRTKLRRGSGFVIAGTPNTHYPLTYGGTDLNGAEYMGGDMICVGTDITNFGPTIEVSTGVYRNCYILGNDNGTAKFFKPDGSGTLKKGKAYLRTSYELTSSSNAPGFSLVISNGTTGITEMQKMGNADNETVFNLNGQRVAQPTKGLYIVNGKKVIIK